MTINAAETSEGKSHCRSGTRVSVKTAKASLRFAEEHLEHVDWF